MHSELSALIFYALLIFFDLSRIPFIFFECETILLLMYLQTAKYDSPLNIFQLIVHFIFELKLQ